MATVGKRKLSAAKLVRRIVVEVWHHPNNRGRRVRAVVRSVAWQVRKRVRPQPFVRPVFDRSRIWMDPTAGSASNLIYFGDRFDLEEMTFLERYLRAGDRFVDVGANIGTYTLLAAELVGPTGQVDAVEAVPALVAKLQANVDLNDLGPVVRVHPVAVSDQAGTAEFRIDMDVSNRLAAPTDAPGRRVVVDVARLDDLVDGAVAVAKIDVEGAEERVLTGFADQLGGEEPPVLLLEVLDHQLRRMGSSSEAIWTLLDQAGYGLARFDLTSGTLVEIEPADVTGGNVLAVPRRRWDHVVARLGAG